MAECFMSADERLQISISKKIEKKLQRDGSLQRKELKILLLGTGESGKSTFVKQMRIIHGKGFSEEDCIGYKSQVCSNVVLAIRTLLTAVKDMQLKLDSEDHEDCVHVVEKMDASEVSSISQEEYQAIKTLWKDGGIQLAYERRREFHLSDSAKYYLDSLDRICSQGYIPSEHDVLRTRAATRGLLEYKFTINNTLFCLVDVGGQRSERRKWIHAFEGVTSVIFLTAMSEYDQKLRLEETEGQTVGRMDESIALFHTILMYPWFERSSIILFLNKKDLLKEKIQTSDLMTYYPNYTGPPKDYSSARQFISNLFLKPVPPSRSIYSHFTCATDTQAMKVVFRCVRDHLLVQNLTKSCLY